MSTLVESGPSAEQSHPRALAAILLLWAAVVLVYWNPNQPGKVLLGLDYEQLHARRMHFAREALLGPSHSLPSWYPREMLGTPFRANLQNFPLIPNRLLITLLMDPDGTYTYASAITLAAILAASFTFAYCRRLGIGLVGSVGSGWTFACCGYFASRVGAGHLPLLEVYCALPLMLWCIESLIQSFDAAKRSSISLRFVALLIATSYLLLGGHPQIPIYAIFAAACYALLRSGFGRAGWIALLAILLGGFCVAFALLPMAMLVARSTRILPLEQAANDLVLPWKGLLGFFIPWPDGAPSPRPRDPMHGIPDSPIFWDTFCYIGILPWIALLLLGIKAIGVRGESILPGRVARFLLLLGFAGVLLALPPARQLLAALPGTLLRSPARLIYLTEFSLAVALGAAIHLVLTHSFFAGARWLVPAALAVHAVDLSSQSRRFFVQLPSDFAEGSRLVADAIQLVGDSRIAVDQKLPLQLNRRIDDIGVFDSILLARPYQWLLRLSDWSPQLNRQNFDGSELSLKALQASGVRFVVTTRTRADLQLKHESAGLKIYQIDQPAPRAGFVPTDGGSEEMRQVEYRRPSSDGIHCVITNAARGTLRVIEAWDPGWKVTVDGKPVAAEPFDETLLSVTLPPGTHEVRFEYQTPGAGAGVLISITAMLLSGGVALLIHLRAKRSNPALTVVPD